MKIGLSKEHIEKGCGIAIEGYSCKDGQLWSYLHKEFVSEIDSPEYRDFLQLVIEALQEKEICYMSNDIFEDYKIVNIYDSPVCCNDSFLDNKVCSTITQAKEKAIAYVFDNMRV